MYNEVRSSIGLTSNACCPYCFDTIESCLHILRDCKFAKEICFVCLHDPRIASRFFQGTLHEWVKNNLSTAINDGVAHG